MYIRAGKKKLEDGTYEDKPGWAKDKQPAQSFGPFRNLGGGDVPASNEVYVDIYSGIK